MLKRTRLRCASLADAPGLATLVVGILRNTSEINPQGIDTLFSQVVGIGHDHILIAQ